MQILEDIGLAPDPRIGRFIDAWIEEAEREIQYEVSVIQSLCVALLASLVGVSWAILVTVIGNAETNLLLWQWAALWTPVLVTILVLVVGVPYYLKRTRRSARERWQMTVKAKTRDYASFLAANEDANANGHTKSNSREPKQEGNRSLSTSTAERCPQAVECDSNKVTAKRMNSGKLATVELSSEEIAQIEEVLLRHRRTPLIAGLQKKMRDVRLSAEDKNEKEWG